MADNDNGDIPAPPAAGARPSAGEAGLRMIPSAMDRHIGNIDLLLVDAIDNARDSFALLKREDDPALSAIYARQGASLANCYAQLLGARDRHCKALRAKD